MKQLTAVVVGFGGRGAAYAKYAMDHPEELAIVGAADPNPMRRETAMNRHNIPQENLYATWQDLAAQPKWRISPFWQPKTICTMSLRWP